MQMMLLQTQIPLFALSVRTQCSILPLHLVTMLHATYVHFVCGRCIRTKRVLIAE